LIPLRDTLPHQRVPLVTLLLIAANVVAFLWELSLSEAELELLVRRCGVVPADYAGEGAAGMASAIAANPWPFLTSQFLHGGWLHLIGNVWVLWIFGDNVEERLGRLRYLLFYVCGGFLAGATHALLMQRSQVPTIGASGAIAAVMGAYMVLFPRARVVTLLPIPILAMFVQLPAVLFMGLWLLIQVQSGAAAAALPDTGGVAWWAHIGGFLVGIALLVVFLPRRRATRAT
jgi:membrane associated rhomboid family serine protease